MRIDSAARLELKRQGFEADSIVPIGVEALIQRNGNVAFDCTDDVHPDVAHIAGLAAKAVGLDVAGIDLVAQDISRPLHEQGGAIVEVNAGPGLLMHIKPAEGKSRPVGRAIIDHIFPEGEKGLIPLVGITGTYGNDIVARLMYQLMSLHGWRTGTASQGGLLVGKRTLKPGNCANWDDARRLLLNCEVEAAVIENDGLEILLNGLAYDRCEVGIVTNIVFTEDMKREDVAHHDFENAEQLIKIYRTQIDVVLPTGTGILNADDENVVAIAEFCDGSVTFFSPDPTQPVIVAHLAQGHRAVIVEQGKIVLAEGVSRTVLCDVAAVSITNQGRDIEQVRYVLAASAAAWALKLPAALIQAGLEGYTA